jgi:hypothetical protein
MLDTARRVFMVAQQPAPSASRRLMLTITLVIVGAALVALFGLRAYHAYQRFQGSALTAGATDVEAIRGWMTLPYLACAYGVPEDALFAALGVPKAGNERLSVKQLVAKYGRDPLATRQAIQHVLLQHLRTSKPGGAP